MRIIMNKNQTNRKIGYCIIFNENNLQYFKSLIINEKARA